MYRTKISRNTRLRYSLIQLEIIGNNIKMDASQLPPVNEKYSSAFKGTKTFTLKQIVRQGDDNPVSYLLELLRWDIEHKSYEFLKHIQRIRSKFNDDYTKGYSVCSPKEFNEIVYNNFNDEELTRNVDYAKVIAYTNAAVSGWNKFIRNSIIADADKSIITKNDLIISYVTIVNQFNDCIIKNSEEYIIRDIANYVDPKYELKGFIIKFQAIHGGDISTPLFVIDHTDAFSVQKYIALSATMIETAKSARADIKRQRWKDYYTFKENYLLLTNIMNQQGQIIYGRSLDYGFALTSHKSQGSTFDTSLVDVNDIVYDRFGQPYTDAEEVNRRLYVAASRCKNKLYLKFGR